MNIDANSRKHFQDAHCWLGGLAGVLCCAGWLISAHAQEAAKPDAPKADVSSAEAQKGKAPSNPNPVRRDTFEFRGGSLHDFIKRVNEHFGVDVFERATIELSWYGTRVPKMRVQHRIANEHGHIGNIFLAYNALGQNGFPNLGKWHWHGGGSDGLPDILTLTPLPSTEGGRRAGFKARALSIKSMSEDQREKIARTIHEFRQTALKRIVEEGLGSEQDFAGEISFNPETDLMLAVGSEAFLDMVESVVNERHKQVLERRPVETRSRPSAESDSKKP